MVILPGFSETVIFYFYLVILLIFVLIIDAVFFI